MPENLFYALELGPEALIAELNNHSELISAYDSLLLGNFPANLSGMLEKFFYNKNASVVEKLIMNDVLSVILCQANSVDLHPSSLLLDLYESNMIPELYLDLMINQIIVLVAIQDNKENTSDVKNDLLYKINIPEDLSAFELYSEILAYMLAILSDN